GASCNGLDGVAGGASTLPPPGGTRLWLGIEPGGRGTESKTDGGDCANAGAAGAAERIATQTAARHRRPRCRGTDRVAAMLLFIAENLANSSRCPPVCH